MTTLRADMAKIVVVPLNERPDPAVMNRLLSLAPEEIRRRLLAVRSDSIREKSLVAHMLARYLARRSLGFPDSALDFRTEENGKPYLASHPDFHFNLSHTDRAVAAAISGGPVGVDIERIRPARLRVADRFFNRAEQAYVHAEPVLLDHRFFEIWTRKEAYVKWSGTGIRILLTSIDTMGGEIGGMLRTLPLDGFALSVCGEALPKRLPVTHLSLEALLNSD